MFKVSHQIINEKTVQVYCTLHCTLVFFMIAFKHSAQQCSENDLVTAESQLVWSKMEFSKIQLKKLSFNLLTIVTVADVVQMLNSSDLRPDHYVALDCPSHPS